MLTVKYITLRGEEFLYTTPVVNFVPARAKGRPPGTEVKEPRDSVFLDTLGNPRFEIEDGTIFVMNERGKTVSRYDLGASEVPFGAEPIYTGQPIRVV